jgi:serine/threonine-protein kinase HipA
VANELVVLLNGERTGVVQQIEGGKLTLAYDDSWRDRIDAYPVSLSIPLTRPVHPDTVVRPYLDGLLPDHPSVLQRWARRFGVSAGNPFALLQHMGQDCAGAVQFVPPERLPEVLDPDRSGLDWLTDQDVAERLRDLVTGQGTGRLASDHGHFSLAGAQPKTALIHVGGRWGVPSGALPTTHILKPPAQSDVTGFDVNEHFCLRLARNLGLDAAESTVRTFDGQPAIVVARYDRRWLDTGYPIRRHQEDACQALGISPWDKYEADGGPGAAEIVKLLLNESDDPAEDVGAFLDALALNWVLAGTDAHAKNYSVLIGPGSVRLAPLYDLVSALPYPKWIPYRKARLAMRIGSEYHIWKIRSRHWVALAERCDLDREPVLGRVSELVAAVPHAVAETAEELRDEGLVHDVVDQLENEIRRHAEACLRHVI